MRPAGECGNGGPHVEGKVFLFFRHPRKRRPIVSRSERSPRTHTLTHVSPPFCYTKHTHTVSKHRTLQPYGGAAPSLGAGAFVAPGASVVGDVTIGDRASVWYNAVVRGKRKGKRGGAAERRTIV